MRGLLQSSGLLLDQQVQEEKPGPGPEKQVPTKPCLLGGLHHFWGLPLPIPPQQCFAILCQLLSLITVLP